MSAKHRCNPDGSRKAAYPINPFTLANAGRSRASLLAGASLIALAALGAPDRARAACSGANQTVSSPSFQARSSARAAILQSTPARASPGVRQASTPRIAGSAR